MHSLVKYLFIVRKGWGPKCVNSYLLTQNTRRYHDSFRYIGMSFWSVQITRNKTASRLSFSHSLQILLPDFNSFLSVYSYVIPISTLFSITFILCRIYFRKHNFLLSINYKFRPLGNHQVQCIHC
jgi:hypothetical protein